MAVEHRGPKAKGVTAQSDIPATDTPKATEPHASGKSKYDRFTTLYRGLLWATYFNGCIMSIFVTQMIGLPLYLINRDLYYSYIAVTKQSFALLIVTMTQWWGPSTIRISGDESVAGQIRQTADGLVEFDFPERIIMIANHQIYTDWLYLWWVAYANNPGMHGHIYIILKESLKYIPFLGTGMMLYGFIFMSRKMATDQPRLAYRLNKLKSRHAGAVGPTTALNPMWLLLFPEGTNLSGNGRRKSAAWAKKTGLRDPEHVLLPRSTGMYFCIKELGNTVDYIYDCTVAYEGIPRGGYGEEHFGLVGTYFQGQAPKSVNFHWRRFKVADIPLDTAEEFDEWLRARWYEKDLIMEEYVSTGRFPALTSGPYKYVETRVRTKHWFEFGKIFVVVALAALVARNVAVVWSWMR
ncbi:1-acyl-sn-glycerol-3-phosphate acyltransferase [Plectosphaerella plurivora]|uniref:1-acyl-sn-glycerol-3-phosphate acyltransferase n=1 Tax=Plectosphaerella plurivora TaxID=936078 RepID=A0A9P8V0Z2_9PEZI|nr:1-acyl-sn-glycerol-3-phosphate acyltransferase [Plectosphaerella plurivora]